MSKLLSALALRPATLERIEAYLRDGGGEERQPPPRKFVFSDRRRKGEPSDAAPTLAVWTGQDPAERIANTILLCAIRDRAHQVTLAPSDKGVRVSFQAASGVLREQKLPTFALAPIVQHFKALSGGEITPQKVEGVESNLYRAKCASRLTSNFTTFRFRRSPPSGARASKFSFRFENKIRLGV